MFEKRQTQRKKNYLKKDSCLTTSNYWKRNVESRETVELIDYVLRQKDNVLRQNAIEQMSNYELGVLQKALQEQDRNDKKGYKERF